MINQNTPQALARIHQTMRLEDQAMRPAELDVESERQIDKLLEGRASLLWGTNE